MPKVNRHRTSRIDRCRSNWKVGSLTMSAIESSSATNTARDLVESLVESVANAEPAFFVAVPEDEFSCSHCKTLLYRPATAPCGHSFCPRCSRKPKVYCRHCMKEQTSSSFSRLNVVLKAILEAWYPKEYSICQLIGEGDELIAKNSFKEAELKFSKVLKEKPFHNYATIRRAVARKAQGDWHRALTDIIVVQTRRNCLEQEFDCKKQFIDDITNQEIEIATKTAKMFLEVISLFGTNDQSVSCENEKPFSGWVTPNQNYPVGKFSPPAVYMMKPPARRKQDNKYLLSECRSALDAIILENLSSTNLKSMILAALECTYHRLGTSAGGSQGIGGTVGSDKLDENDYCCILCTRPFFDPVCTPCGHTFCLECLERCFDHGRACPMCKTPLSDIYQYQKFLLSIDWSVDSFIKRKLPTLCQEKEKLQEEESLRLRKNLPVFVCTVAYPHVQCLLHVFEPRYRLMIRRALKLHGGSFGMAIPSSTSPFHYIGTVISLENVSFYPDGRSLVTAIGTRRFEVEEYGSCDGYCTAKVKYISDKENTEESEILATKNLADEVYQKAKIWFENSSAHVKQTIRTIHGDFPEQDDTAGTDGPKWGWWLVSVLPLKDDVKAYILGKDSFRTRLNMMDLILQKIESKTRNEPGK